LAISKKQKQELVSLYQELVRKSSGMVLASYSGMRVSELEGLRRKLRESGAEFRIVKNTLMELALQQAGLPVPKDSFIGTTAVGFASEDVLAMAKAIVDLSRTSEAIKVKGAVVDGVAYGTQQVQMLADLPPMPVLRALLLGVISAPATRVAGALAGSVRQVVNVVKAYSEKAPAGAA
jgi:large subunit ribosomal protein L10